MPVLGICNGFQILCEAHLLPGALIRNADAALRLPGPAAAYRAHRHAAGPAATPTGHDRHPVKHGEGNYVADAATLDRLEGEGRVVARYLPPNPNGSSRDIAGICNERGNVSGLMPHPEHAIDPLTGPSRRRPAVLHQRARSLVEA